MLTEFQVFMQLEGFKRNFQPLIANILSNVEINF